MIFTYYSINVEKTIDIEVDNIMLLHPMLNGDTTAVMLEIDGIEYSYVMYNKFDSIPLNNNFIRIYNAMNVYININLLKPNMIGKKIHLGEEVLVFKFKTMQYIIPESIMRELKIRELLTAN
jgi:hypothetical protein